MRPNRRSEMIRYRQFVRSTLGNWLSRQERVMHPDFALSDGDAADVMDAIEKELFELPKTLFMLTVSTRPPAGSPTEESEPGYCLGVRFGYAEDIVHLEDLLIKQVRSRYPTYKGMRPRDIRRTLSFNVWEVPMQPGRGGWPVWAGESGYWH